MDYKDAQKYYYETMYKVSSFTYNEDTGVLSFEYWTGNTYDVHVSGNTLTIEWTNQKDQWDTDWFGNSNVFYRE